MWFLKALYLWKFKQHRILLMGNRHLYPEKLFSWFYNNIWITLTRDQMPVIDITDVDGYYFYYARLEFIGIRAD